MVSRERLQIIVNEFLFKLGNDRALVSVEKVSDPKIIAGARGAKLFNTPIGQIYINGANLHAKELSDDELKFVLAHEVVHIDQNHLPVTVLFKLPKEILDALGKVYPEKLVSASVISLIWDLIKLWIYRRGGLPPEAAITKQQELQADIWAIFLTDNNKTSAISCLKKLVNYNLNQHSHLWEALDIKLPVMTMRERIDEITQTISYFESQGYRFM